MMSKELLPQMDLEAMRVDAAALGDLSEEALAETFIRAERLAIASRLWACACADEFRRRYSGYGEGWYKIVAQKLGKRPATIYRYSAIWRVYQEILRGGTPSQIETFSSLRQGALDEIGNAPGESRVEAAYFTLALVAQRGEPSGRVLRRALLDKGLVGRRPRRQREFGAPLDFRELRHEPVNEQGVVFLFGMVARELGFVVESVQTGFPDCTAKRRRAKTGRYVRVDVEFEFKSSDFRDHGHDPSHCDLIVCWEDDWPDCPLEVLELKSAIAGLDPHV